MSKSDDNVGNSLEFYLSLVEVGGESWFKAQLLYFLDRLVVAEDKKNE